MKAQRLIFRTSAHTGLRGSWQRQQGFSLLELLVAFSIMAMSLGMLYRVNGNNVRLTGTLERQAHAIALAESLLTSASAVPETGLNLNGETTGLWWAMQSGPYETPLSDPQKIKLHRVVTTVEWIEGGQRRQIQLATLLPQRKPIP